MSIHVALNHVTHYRYDRLVALSPQIVRLRPAPHSRTPILSYSMKVTPKQHFINWQQDPQSNYQARLFFPEKTTEFKVEIDLVADMAIINPFDFFLEEEVREYPFDYDSRLDHELAPFFLKEKNGPLFADYMKQVDRKKRKTVDFLVELNQRLQQEIRYTIRMEPGVQTPEQTLQLRSGSCRDSAWLLAQILRHLGFAARFVSGYLIQLTPDVKAIDGPVGAEKDFTDLHAWTEVYLPGAGWIGLDPTSGLLADEGHIPLAATPDPTSAAPITGAVEECECEFSFHMSVERVFERPRTTKPYSEEQWAEIESLGHEVDAKLKSNDVRLTMGGEPTFVSSVDMDGEEWNFTALSPKKRELGAQLLKRLKAKYAPGGMLHFGQGKWYPGESLPRWAFGCYWRRDGVPVWENDALIADEHKDYGFNDNDAVIFTVELATRLGLDPRHILKAYEDAFYYLWKERRLPVNVDPYNSRLRDKEERARLARVFEQGLDKVVGAVLPIQRWVNAYGPYWTSGPWFVRPERLRLIPGDSPVGLRLPQDSLPWARPSDYPEIFEEDPLAAREPLPERRKKLEKQAFRSAYDAEGRQPGSAEYGGGLGEGGDGSRRSRAQTLPPLPPTGPGEGGVWPPPGNSANALIRTALCVEPRDGKLFIFMPPTHTAEDYLDLVENIEETAAELDMPVMLEGYTPPADPRLNVFKVTPDPGVIEVNLHPAHSWDELVKNTTTLYEEARQIKLGAEKFMIDGRHTGTGGGNHIIIGGATPADSPILRRPDLLQSLLAYWHNHPSLSYLFSGMFIGPTSQAPRVDEARNDSIYELDIALKRTPAGGYCPPWLVDRLYRNLLIDVTGNTHRAEFCIDKLYNPDSSTGRLGLLEMRSFEMPPHSRMSLTQQLLLRSLVSKFWEEPYKRQLVPWGSELHDRYMLPHFVEQDFEDVILELQKSGYPIRNDWFAPHFEFRFPYYGEITSRGVHLELRQALEPWNVLGEEGTAGGTVRYVDSSVERLQVKVNGLIDTRHVIACNGRRVPLHPTGTVGEYVAGVRFRAWQPPECLHPTIPVDAPLIFDVVDTWMDRALGGCTYYVSHPGGMNLTRFPINAYEAESRRLARFYPFGHTPGNFPEPKLERNKDFPMTLDFRRLPE
jgi:uncharacterized protein (DUF2126 family)